MPVFRLFGRADDAPASATSHARPARRAEDLLGPPRTDDPPTDPHGFPAVGSAELGYNAAPTWGAPADHATRPTAPPYLGPSDAAAHAIAAHPTTAHPPPPGHTYESAVAALGSATYTVTPPPPERPVEPTLGHPAEAAALAAAFAADYLSWDEDDPDRRSAVLGDYLARRRPVRLGWSGRGRQRADFALPGIVRPDGEGRLLVDVRVRVTPYRPVPGGRTSAPEPDDPGPALPSAAPAPAAKGWRGLPAQWVRLSVAVVVEGDRLVVDAEDEDWAPEPPSDESPAFELDADVTEEDR